MSWASEGDLMRSDVGTIGGVYSDEPASPGSKRLVY